MSRTITIEYRGTTYYAVAATITSTRLGKEGHGVLTADVLCEWPGGGVSVGGRALDAPEYTVEGKFKKRVPTAWGLDHTMKIAETVGVDTWEELPGSVVLVLFEDDSTWGARAVGLAHITDESKVLVFTEHAKDWKDAR